jgi:hypothetical protein
MDGGLWHQTGTSRRSRFSMRAKVGTVLGAGLPLGVAAAKVVGRRRRAAGAKGAERQVRVPRPDPLLTQRTGPVRNRTGPVS